MNMMKMEKLSSGLSIAPALGFLGSATSIKNAALLLVIITMSIGCQVQPAVNEDNGRIQALEKENSNLKEQVDILTKSSTEAVNLLNDITDNLARMTGQETEIRILQEDLGPATWEASSDLREEISNRLKTLQEELNTSKKKHTELSDLTNQPEYAAFKNTIGNLKLMIDEKEQTITALRNEMESLAQQAAELQEEFEESRRENDALREEAQERERTVSAQEKLLTKMRTEVGERYFFAGTPDQIRAALQHGDITKRFRTFRVPDHVLRADQPPRIFSVISPEESTISLGYGRQVKVLSVHRRNDSLYYASCHDECILRLRDPWAFWSVSHHLIVEIQP